MPATGRALGPTVSRKYPAFHAHGCLGCGRRYSDTCATPQANGQCITCRTGQPPAHWDRSRMPRVCCVASSRLITDVAVLNSYGLAGPGPWFQCPCGRTHPFNPTGATASALAQTYPEER